MPVHATPRSTPHRASGNLIASNRRGNRRRRDQAARRRCAALATGVCTRVIRIGWHYARRIARRAARCVARRGDGAALSRAPDSHRNVAGSRYRSSCPAAVSFTCWYTAYLARVPSPRTPLGTRAKEKNRRSFLPSRGPPSIPILFRKSPRRNSGSKSERVKS